MFVNGIKPMIDIRFYPEVIHNSLMNSKIEFSADVLEKIDWWQRQKVNFSSTEQELPS